ncbi:MAG: phage portal protein [Gemmatimonadetes bacterium]|nr:phage portal protein [Gemmatimonadota bacterium]
MSKHVRVRRAGAVGPSLDPRAFALRTGYSLPAKANSDPENYTEQRAVQLAAVQGATGFLARTAARSSVYIERSDDGERWERVYTDLPAWADDSMPSSKFQSSYQMKAHLARSVLIGGAGYILVLGKRASARRLRGYPEHVVTLSNDRVDASIHDGRIVYRVSDSDLEAFARVDQTGDVIALHYWTCDADFSVGISPLVETAPPLRIALAADAHAELLFTQGGLPPSLLVANSGALSSEYQDTIKQYYDAQRRDPEQRHRPLLLEGEWQWLSTFVSPDQMQLLDARKFGWAAVSALYGVPPPFMGAPDAISLGTGVRQLFRFAMASSVEPLLGAMSNAFTQLLPDDYRARFVPEQLLELEPLEKARYYERALAAGWMTVNEIRRREGLSDLPGGNIAAQPYAPDKRERGDSDSGKEQGEENFVEEAV